MEMYTSGTITHTHIPIVLYSVLISTVIICLYKKNILKFLMLASSNPNKHIRENIQYCTNQWDFVQKDQV